MLNKANRDYLSKDYNSVVEKCNLILNKNPLNHRALNLRGVAFYFLKNFEESLSDLNEATNLYVDEVYFYNLSLTQYKMSKYNDCMISLSNISDSTKTINKDELFLHKANVLFNLSKYNNAIKYFEYTFNDKALENSLMINKIVNYYQNENYDTSFYLLNNFISLDSITYAYLFHASSAFNLNLYKTSISSFNKYLVNNDNIPQIFISEYSQALSKYADSLVLSNDRINALEFYSKSIEVDPTNKHAFFQRGVLYYENSLFDKAFSDMSNAAMLGNFNSTKYLEILK